MVFFCCCCCALGCWGWQTTGTLAVEKKKWHLETWLSRFSTTFTPLCKPLLWRASGMHQSHKVSWRDLCSCPYSSPALSAREKCLEVTWDCISSAPKNYDRSQRKVVCVAWTVWMLTSPFLKNSITPDRFAPFLDASLVDFIRQTGSHSNHFIREAGLCTSDWFVMLKYFGHSYWVFDGLSNSSFIRSFMFHDQMWDTGCTLCATITLVCHGLSLERSVHVRPKPSFRHISTILTWIWIWNQHDQISANNGRGSLQRCVCISILPRSF